ncbi:hypothetical protein B0T24DRAFT_617752 [Lasiosphaeria ovina]|uniref:Nucleoporin Pom152 n=1 Tax=Lasiosphaeria ovina TaxID=92902 RepID=A0AAE0NAA1_9PEZI|nr:hypothetical protein B0T24DRAFT_617752 [Lasiosphaeria ovina]
MSDGAPPIGAFPQTPVAGPRRGPAPAGSSDPPKTVNSTPPLPVAPRQGTAPSGNPAPLIPLNVLDAPTQRLYAFAIYAGLLAWKLYDWTRIVEEDAESFWLLLKWVAIDFVVLFGLPELRIPWLELSQPFVVVVFFCHVVFDWVLMFNFGLPWQTWLFGLVKVFYDREIAISERNVKLSNIIHNSSLIMGRQIINILPEGSAALNPDQIPFCLGGDRKIAPIPIFFNATVPVEVQLIRTDLESNVQEIIKLTRVQLRDIERRSKVQTQDGSQVVVRYDYPAKKAGAYQLGKVLDEYKLEVQRKTPFTFVVPCPRAWVGPAPSSGRCVGDLSDLSIHVEGTPPLKIMYSRKINSEDSSFHFQSLQPEGFSSPLTGSSLSTSITDPTHEDISWARPRVVPIGLNESMGVSGSWQYSVDEVRDGFQNVVKYTAPADDPDGKPKPKDLVQNFVVKERPRIQIEGCDLRKPIKAQKGQSTELPVRFHMAQLPDDTSHSLIWEFSPIDTLTESGDHGRVVIPGSYRAKNSRDRPKISAPGLYTLKSVVAGACEGEVQEPSSCLLLNPLEPKLEIRSEEISDTCAGNSIGLRVDMDLIGTPPFTVKYDIVSNNVDRESKTVRISSLRHQIELIPRFAGHHKYTFTHIGDGIYDGKKLVGQEYVLEQDVKPAASAMIQHSTSGNAGTCLGDEVAVDIVLLGEPPFTLEWELIHDGKRKHQKATNIADNHFQIKTAALTQGGEYTLALTSIQDKRACRSFLQDELKISVRRQSPRAAFGQIDGKRKTLDVEGSTVKLPLRLTGEGPWTVRYTNLLEGALPDAKVLEKTVDNSNGFLDVQTRGVFTITDVRDNQCPGIVDPNAGAFEVDWFPRPELSVISSPAVHQEGSDYVVASVCEGDISGFEVSLKGTAPYHVEYQVRHQPIKGPSSVARKAFDATSGKSSILGDTAKAGQYTYTFSSLADNLYNSGRDLQSLVVKQVVNRKPTASFVKPGQTFKYCKSEGQDEDKIPIELTGVPPFSLDIEIKHQGAPIPEIYRTPSFNSHSYEIQIPRHLLKLGTQHIRLRDVRDGSGCHSMTDIGAPSVQVQLFEAPTIYPMETRTDYCVGERLSYTLSGTPPFEVWYTFDGAERKAKSPTTSFRRLAETPGEFAIATVSDRASECRSPVNIVKNIHPMPAVKISKGRNVQVDIHEGGEVEILFEFWGTPPFEFTYTRSSNARKGLRSQVLETRHDVSHEHSKVVRASQEGTYEVVAIKDKFCAFSTQQEERNDRSQKTLKYH